MRHLAIVRPLAARRLFEVWARAAALLAAVALLAASHGFEAAAQAANGHRVALVVGNGAYTTVPKLANPAGDARAMSEALRAVGFQVVEAIDADRRAMFAALVAFAQKAQGADAALVFYAGHGVQVDGENWLLPVDASVSSTTELRADAVRLNDVTQALDDAGARVKIVLLDACRDNPFPIARTRSSGGGLAPVSTASAAGTLVAFATAPGAVAADGEGRNSPFTEALIQEIGKPGVEIRQMLGAVRSRVYAATAERQIPWVNEALIGSFYFSAAAEERGGPAPTAAETEPGLTEKEAFDLAKEIGTPGAWNAFLESFPEGQYAGFAKAALAKSLSARNRGGGAPAAKPVAAARASDFIFPDSATRLLTRADVKGMSRKQLRLARNEIYARRGRFFKAKDLRAHFGAKPWYKPTSWVVSLNPIERKNVAFLLLPRPGR